MNWPAPVAASPLDAVVPLPGSKSLVARHLVLAGLADGPSRLRRPLVSRDSTLMVQALQALGALVTESPGQGDPDWTVSPAALAGDADVDAGLSGTVMRFVTALAGLARGDVHVHGDPNAARRPMAPLVGALRDLGVRIDASPTDGLPLTVHGRGGVRGGELTLDASASSQFVSGLLLAAPRFEAPLTVRHDGPDMPSRPHVAMTVEVLRRRGVQVDDSEPDVWRVVPGPIAGDDVVIEPDLSNAAAFLAAAAVVGGTVTVPDWPEQTTQPGRHILDILAAFDAATHTVTAGALQVTGTGRIHGADLDLRDAAELTPVVAAVAALADSPSTLHGIGYIRGHETDRLAALTAEINALGGQVRELDDGLRIVPKPLHGGVFHTYADHRIVHTGALLGLVTPGVEIENVETVAKTLPRFTRLWSDMVGAA